MTVGSMMLSYIMWGKACGELQQDLGLVRFATVLQHLLQPPEIGCAACGSHRQPPGKASLPGSRLKGLGVDSGGSVGFQGRSSFFKLLIEQPSGECPGRFCMSMQRVEVSRWHHFASTFKKTANTWDIR